MPCHRGEKIIHRNKYNLTFHKVVAIDEKTRWRLNNYTINIMKHCSNKTIAEMAKLPRVSYSLYKFLLLCQSGTLISAHIGQNGDAGPPHDQPRGIAK